MSSAPSHDMLQKVELSAGTVELFGFNVQSVGLDTNFGL